MTTSPSSSELNLQFKPQTQSQNMLDHNYNSPDQLTFQKLHEYLHRLEEERVKIDAFKRELPLCMNLLTHEMETSRKQLQSYNKENQETKPVLEQFMPLKVSSNSRELDQKPTNISEKANWMTSAQLWSQSSDGKKQQSTTLKLDFDTKQRNGGGFLPFGKDPELGLASKDMEMEGEKVNNEYGNVINGLKNEDSNKEGNQSQRKARRCWSPDLHRRFVNALQILGGSEVATPKQIRELMKVDGLTNDEVKSHLQKYRLHTRRPGPAPPPAAGAPTPQLVVIGGIWVPQEYTTGTAAVHTGAPAIYGGTHTTTQVSSQYCYPLPSPPLQPPQAHTQFHHHHHHQVHVLNTSSRSQVHSSPESDPRGVGDRSESIEDGKSENSSGDYDGDGKKLDALQDDGGESNGNEIILEF